MLADVVPIEALGSEHSCASRPRVALQVRPVETEVATVLAYE